MAMVVPLPQSHEPVVGALRVTLQPPTRQVIAHAGARPSTQRILSTQPCAAERYSGPARLQVTGYLVAFDQDSGAVDQRRCAVAAPPGQWSA